MARPKAPPPVGVPSIAPPVAIVRLRELKDRLEKTAAQGGLSTEEADTLRFALERTLRDALGENHEDIDRIVYAGRSLMIDINAPEAKLARNRADRTRQQARLLSELIIHFERDIVEAAVPKVARPPRHLERVERLALRFHQIAKRLRVRHDKRDTLDVKDEYDVQDLLHALLRLYFDDVRTEEWTPSYAGKASRMDFLLKAEKLVIEVKMTRDGLGEKEVGEQLIVDIARYHSHPDCTLLFCFVYDPLGRIGNPEGLEHDLSGVKDGLPVKVLITPRV